MVFVYIYNLLALGPLVLSPSFGFNQSYLLKQHTWAGAQRKIDRFIGLIFRCGRRGQRFPAFILVESSFFFDRLFFRTSCVHHSNLGTLFCSFRSRRPFLCLCLSLLFGSCTSLIFFSLFSLLTLVILGHQSPADSWAFVTALIAWLTKSKKRFRLKRRYSQSIISIRYLERLFHAIVEVRKLERLALSSELPFGVDS